MLRTLNLYLFLWLTNTVLCAQNSQWSVFQLTKEKGLPHNWVHCGLLDNQGFMWFGTDDGLSRFDGSKIKTFQHKQGDSLSIARNKIRAMVADKSGNFWLASISGGLSYFNPHSGKNFSYPTPIHPIKKTSAVTGLSLCIDKFDNVWYGTYDHGLYCFDTHTQQFSHFDIGQEDEVLNNSFQKNTVNEIISDDLDPNILWLASNDYANGLIKLKIKTKEFEKHDVFGAVMTLLKEKGNTLWVGTWGAGLVKYDTKTDKFKRYLILPDAFKKADWNANVVKSIYRKSPTELWIMCYDTGLWVFDETTETFKRAVEHPELVNAGLIGMYAVSPDLLWLFKNNGAYRLSRKDTLPIREVMLPLSNCLKFRDADVTDFAQDPLTKNIFASFGRCDGIYVFDAQYNSLTNFITHIDSDKVIKTLLFDRDRKLWAGGSPTQNHNFSLYFFDLKSLKWSPINYESLLKLDIHKSSIMDLMLSRDGKIWIANDKQGLICFNPQTQEATEPLKPLNTILKVNEVKEAPNGDIWAITELDGVIQYTPTTQRIKTYKQDPKNPKSLFEKGGTTLEIAANGKIWVGMTYDGIQIIDPALPENQNLKSITTEDGLPYLSVSKLLRDNFNNIWISTRNGICVYNWQSQYIRRFPFGEKSEDFSFFPKGLCQIIDNTLLFGLNKSFIAFPPSVMHYAKKKNYIVRITDFKIFEKSQNFDRPFDSTSIIILKPDESLFSISFAAVNAIDPENITYRYRLNNESDWIYCGHNTEVTFANIPYGYHDFEVQCRYEDGDWQGQITHLNVFCRAPFYKTPWFYTVLAIAFVCLVYFIYKNRVKQIKYKENLKTELNRRLSEVKIEALRAQMNPHFIFNCLNSINSYIMQKDEEAASYYLTKFAKLIRRVLDQSRLELISLEEDIDILKLFVELEKQRFGDNFHYRFEIDPQLPIAHIKVPPMLIQPYVENAIWHGLKHKRDGQSILLIRVEGEEHDFTITVSDNGIGREKSAQIKQQNAIQNRSHGTNVTLERILFVNARYQTNIQVDIQDLFDANSQAAGTKVLIHFKGKDKEHPIFTPLAEDVF